MADNTTINSGSGGDIVRDLARQSGTIKTQVVQLDLGGTTANAEVLITAGQQISANSVPVVMASDYAPPVPQTDRLNLWFNMQSVVLAAAAAQNQAGFVPLEIPSFLTGL